MKLVDMTRLPQDSFESKASEFQASLRKYIDQELHNLHAGDHPMVQKSGESSVPTKSFLKTADSSRESLFIKPLKTPSVPYPTPNQVAEKDQDTQTCKCEDPPTTCTAEKTHRWPGPKEKPSPSSVASICARS